MPCWPRSWRFQFVQSLQEAWDIFVVSLSSVVFSVSRCWAHISRRRSRRLHEWRSRKRQMNGLEKREKGYLIHVKNRICCHLTSSMSFRCSSSCTVTFRSTLKLLWRKNIFPIRPLLSSIGKMIDKSFSIFLFVLGIKVETDVLSELRKWNTKGYEKVWNTLNQFHLDENINRFVVFFVHDRTERGKKARKSLRKISKQKVATYTVCCYDSIELERSELSGHLLRNDLLNQMRKKYHRYYKLDSIHVTKWWESER